MTYSTKLVLSLALCAAPAGAQLAGTQAPTEEHPMLHVQECTTKGGCATVSRGVVLDANWRWADESGTNCYDGNAWTSLCDGQPNCTATCAIEGGNYEGTYGIKTEGHNLTLGYVTRGTYGNNVGSRTYLMAEDDTNYEMFHLNNREFTFDVDVSTLPCGVNAALYFVEMSEDGDLGKGNNQAGAAFGTGYCDAQCPHDVKYINGEANSLDWVETTATSGKGKYGSCCIELDIWEGNTVSNAFTPHPCDTEGLLKCDGVECGDNDAGERYQGTCDKDGCDYAPFRMGAQSFYGSSSDFTIDSSRPFTVVTQFVTDDGTDDGVLKYMTRKYVQDGKVVENPAVDVGGTSYDAVSDEFCAAQKTLFGDENAFDAKGGMATMGKANDRGLVLVMSLWDDWEVNMLWLDSTYPTDADKSTPGVFRGTCPTDSGVPATLEANYPTSYVKYYNIRSGELDSTYGDDFAVDDKAVDDAAPATDDGAAPTCVDDYAQCGGTSWDGIVYGPFDCCSGATCTHSSSSYWQCTP